ncbi:transposase [Bordetella genomosp. 1]|uniref:Transposase n=1 Tax=Bordetella genomosp. 1 TaxID=1395607 RepID=A0A261SEL4_9BORD|nr:transposase [Bordetella genomosp. 1]OZI35402.1 transposase [Bordetella genomosp. 1]
MSPRLARVVVAHLPHHVVQRGHSRQTVFAGDDHYLAYLSDIEQKSRELDVAVHAYCLMPNHVHLLLTPTEPPSVGRLMKEVARRATVRWNRRFGRSGTLWESRYRSSVVQTERYFLACCRYIELNPVRAGLVARPEEYPWSSYCARLREAEGGVLALHPAYLALGATLEARQRVYRALAAQALHEDELMQIRGATQTGNPLATSAYCRALQTALARPVVTARRGRPRKENAV